MQEFSIEALGNVAPQVEAVVKAARSPDDLSGQLKSADKVVHLDRSGAEGLVDALRDTAFEVRSVESKPYRRSPYAPFRTTTLQQEAGRKLGMSAQVTMSVAQRLYENGFITHMRTDSTTLSGAAVGAARPVSARLRHLATLLDPT